MFAKVKIFLSLATGRAQHAFTDIMNNRAETTESTSRRGGRLGVSLMLSDDNDL